VERFIIHIHIPAFPIAVERVCQPGLQGRPVVVAPPRSERGLILSVSSEARQEGIFKGMPIGKARKYCPGLTVLPPNPELTGRASQVLTRVATQYSPLCEPFRPGHVYLDVTGTERLWGRAREAADRLRREIRERLRLSGVAGVAGNKMVSSIASRIRISEAVRDVNHGQEALFMAPLKVDMLPGIGHVRRRLLLEELNISLVREIAAMDPGGLGLVFGRRAYVIHQRALGIDPTPVYPPPKKPVVSEDITLSRDENDDRRLLGILFGLVERCAYRLRTRALVPRRAGLMIRYTDQDQVVRRIVLPNGSFWDLDLYDPLEKAFFDACRRRVRMRYMRIWFQDLLPPDPQLSLFPPASPPGKKTSVTRALDSIRERHGEEAITYGRAA
jgi:DNA polymerase-4